MIAKTLSPLFLLFVSFLMLSTSNTNANELNPVVWNTLSGIQVEKGYLISNHSYSLSKAIGQQIIGPGGIGTIVFYPEKNTGQKFFSLGSVNNTIKDYGDYSFFLSGSQLSILVNGEEVKKLGEINPSSQLKIDVGGERVYFYVGTEKVFDVNRNVNVSLYPKIILKERASQTKVPQVNFRGHLLHFNAINSEKFGYELYLKNRSVVKINGNSKYNLIDNDYSSDSKSFSIRFYKDSELTNIWLEGKFLDREIRELKLVVKENNLNKFTIEAEKLDFLQYDMYPGGIKINDPAKVVKYVSDMQVCQENKNRNWSRTVGFDFVGNPISISASYFDKFGKLTQAQSKNIERDQVLASEVLYDNHGREAITTLQAPVNSSRLCFKENFVQRVDGKKYALEDYDATNYSSGNALSQGEILAPKPIKHPSTSDGTLGYYYSNSNHYEPYNPMTQYPYSRVIYNDRNIGEEKGGALPGNQHRAGSNHETWTFDMNGVGELAYVYGVGRSFYVNINTTGGNGVFATTGHDVIYADKIRKSVSYSSQGDEAVTFYSKDGNVLVNCLSGDVDGADKKIIPVKSFLHPRYGYVDIHIPRGCQGSLVLPVGFRVDIVDLKSDKVVHNDYLVTASNQTPSIQPGVYRIVDSGIENDQYNLIDNYDRASKEIKYNVNYYNFNINYYDKANRLVANIPPLGFDNDYVPQFNTSDHHLWKNFYEYSNSPKWSLANGSALNNFNLTVPLATQNDYQFTGLQVKVVPINTPVSGGVIGTVHKHTISDPQLGVFKRSLPIEKQRKIELVSSFRMSANIPRVNLVHVSGEPVNDLFQPAAPGPGGGTNLNQYCMNGLPGSEVSTTPGSHCRYKGNQDGYPWGYNVDQAIPIPTAVSNSSTQHYCVTCKSTPNTIPFDVRYIITYSIEGIDGNNSSNNEVLASQMKVRATKKGNAWTIEYASNTGQYYPDIQTVYDAIINPAKSLLFNQAKLAISDIKEYKPISHTGTYNGQAYTYGTIDQTYDFKEIDELKIGLLGTTHYIHQKPNHRMATLYDYDAEGKLLSQYSPDEGKAEFLYRKDGQIRFSQSAEQKQRNAFSYTNYDNLGRPVESGEYRTSDKTSNGKPFRETAQKSNGHWIAFKALSNSANINLKGRSTTTQFKATNFFLQELSKGDVVVNQDFANSKEGWVLTSGATYVNPSLNAVRVNASSTWRGVQQYFETTPGKYYNITLKLQETSSNLMVVSVGDSYGQYHRVFNGDGTEREFLFRARNSKTQISVKVLSGTAPFEFNLTKFVLSEMNAVGTPSNVSLSGWQSNLTSNPTIFNMLPNGIHVTNVQVSHASVRKNLSVTAGRYYVFMADFDFVQNSSNHPGMSVSSNGFPNNWSDFNIDYPSTVEKVTTAQNVKFQNYYNDYNVSGYTSSLSVLDNAYLPGNDMADGLNKLQCFDVNHTVYDIPDPQLANILSAEGINASNYRQSFLSGNVSKSYNAIHTTWYSYDEQGRVAWMVQQIEGLGVKTIDYFYDHRGNVKDVVYQKNKTTEYFGHRYEYDKNNQLVKVYTKNDPTRNWVVQSAMSYYLHGALKRETLGESKKLQGIDYTYTVQGALKAINHPTLENRLSSECNMRPGNFDPGRDGFSPSAYAPDVFGMSIDYFSGDYTRSGTDIVTGASGVADRFDGFIKAVRWNNKTLTASNQMLPGWNRQWKYEYNYDNQLFLKEANFMMYSPAYCNNRQQHAEGNISLGQDYRTQYTYDANGNLLSLNRNGYTQGAISNPMDQLSYQYSLDGNGKRTNNQLTAVKDAVSGDNYTTDISSQTANNYMYNVKGQLVKDKGDNAYYSYNTTGLVSRINQLSGNLKGNLHLSLHYGNNNHRVRKTNHNSKTKQYYVRNARGSIMAIYSKDENNVVKMTAVPVYGTSRIGMYNKVSNRFSYELKDHLGNVRTVISDTKDHTGKAQFLTYSDYYPFGMLMPDRNSNPQDYRFAFQGQEKDEETGKEAFQLRLWDGRIGRWLTTDPKFEFSSPYLGMGNIPTHAVDPDGGDIVVLGDSKAVNPTGLKAYGHNSVLIGNQEDGWRYVSINGTGEGASGWGDSKNADLGDNIIGKGMTAEEVAVLVNTINSKENHHYDVMVHIKSSPTEDKLAYAAARKEAAVKTYGICFNGNSCIDPPQAAVGALLDYRARQYGYTSTVFRGMHPYYKNMAGLNMLIPNNFINQLQSGLNRINKNLFSKSKKEGFIEVGRLTPVGYEEVKP